MNIEGVSKFVGDVFRTIGGKIQSVGRTVQKAIGSVIDGGPSLGCKIFSMAQRIFGSKRDIQAGGDVTSKLLDFSNGKFELNATNAKSFWDLLKTNGAKFIVPQLTDKEIFGLINSDFLSISQKSQIFEAYEGRNKTSLEALFAEQLNEKLAPLGFNEDSIAKFFGVLPDPQKFTNYMLDIFANTSSENLPGVLEFYFGFAGIFPLQDLSKEHLEALSQKIENFIPSLDEKRLDEIQKQVAIIQANLVISEQIIKNPVYHRPSKIEEAKQEGKDLADTKEKLLEEQKRIYTETGKAKACLLGLKCALGVCLGQEGIKEGIEKSKNGTFSSDINLIDTFLSRDRTVKPENKQEIFSALKTSFDKLIAPKPTPTEKILEQIFMQAKNVGELDSLKQLQNEDLTIRKIAISKLITTCMGNNLDPTPVLSLYPKTTLEVFRETFEEIRYSDSQRTPEAFFAKINILIEIGSRAKDIFPLPPVSKDFSDAEIYQHFLDNFQTLLNKLLEFREEYNISSNKDEVYEKGRDWVRKEISALQGTIRTFESLCEDANRTV